MLIRRVAVALAATAVVAAAGCGDNLPLDTCGADQAIIGGVTDAPIGIHPAEARAEGALRANGQLFCSATLVGDRVVLTAAHCLIGNVQAWLQGAAPEPAVGITVTFAIGPDAAHPDCELPVESFEINPDARRTGEGANIHDQAVVILATSATTGCPGVTPIAVQLAPLPDLAGREIVEGGYGAISTEPNPPENTLRHWATFAGATTTPPDVYATFDGHGTAYYGDSGSGLLVRLPDGVLRVIGTVWVGLDNGDVLGSRTDASAAWLSGFVGVPASCGELGNGVCIDGLAARCGAAGPAALDCTATGRVCLDGTDGPRCVDDCMADP